MTLGHHASTDADVPVLFAGGGLVGLSTAMFLAQHGIASLRSSACAADRSCRAPRSFTCARSNCSARPASKMTCGRVARGVRARGIHRVDGHPRGQGAQGAGPGSQRGRRRLQSLPPPVRHAAGLEPILRRRAEGSGARVLAGHEVIGFEQDATGVTTAVRDSRRAPNGPSAPPTLSAPTAPTAVCANLPASSSTAAASSRTPSRSTSRRRWRRCSPARTSASSTSATRTSSGFFRLDKT